jgi:hypothetical protein
MTERLSLTPMGGYPLLPEGRTTPPVMPLSASDGVVRDLQKLNDPRQSRGLISVSPSKGRLKSALKSAQSPVGPDRCCSLRLSTLRQAFKRALPVHDGTPRALVNRCSDAPIGPLLVRKYFFLAPSFLLQRTVKPPGVAPAKPGAYLFVGYDGNNDFRFHLLFFSKSS